jgi:hypothetical protein
MRKRKAKRILRILGNTGAGCYQFLTERGIGGIGQYIEKYFLPCGEGKISRCHMGKKYEKRIR